MKLNWPRKHILKIQLEPQICPPGPGPPRSNPLGPQTHPDSFLSQEGPRVQRWGRSRQEIKYILSSGPFVQVTLDFWASQLNE